MVIIPIIKDIFVTQGAGFELNGVISNNGTPIDITSATFTLAISRYEGASALDISPVFTKTTPATGQFRLSIPESQTSLFVNGRYVYTIFVEIFEVVNKSAAYYGQVLVKNSPATITTPQT